MNQVNLPFRVDKIFDIEKEAEPIARFLTFKLAKEYVRNSATDPLNPQFEYVIVYDNI